ncbi:helix-turn-helix transcriptional regulator [Flagellimonas hymeniacidonis]|uniref:Helix-turn-helix transcriptional regulator n=1 Tax=Flagellimonas hymeniacidonis TaxID=2603628 RepID=A0A5C8V9E4_9FLAO|nr:helix-turn-helix domain-containing protein [Flagellimonas hymeniacidonis]TXN37819.1 helix-turn-helix transcriptional regulator [Flagellimonas hymeniacidonis]
MINAYEYFKNHPKFNKLVGNDFLFVEYKCPLNIEEYQLWIENHLITYVISGKKDWITSKKIHKLTAGDTLFVRKGVYTTKQYLESEYCVMLFFINDNFINRFISENPTFKRELNHRNEYRQIFEITTNEAFRTLIKSVFHYLNQGDNIPKELVEIKFKELLYNIVLNSKNKELLFFFNSIMQNSQTTIENIMTENFQYDLKIADFAKLCGKSLSSFKREFKKFFNTTPSRWLINKRLDHSKILLLGTNLTVNEVGYECGFKNNSHFIQAFKKVAKVTPNRYRILKKEV